MWGAWESPLLFLCSCRCWLCIACHQRRNRVWHVLHCEWQLLDVWLLAVKQGVVLAGVLVLSAVGVLFLQWVLYDDCA